MVQAFENLLRTRMADDLETWYVALMTLSWFVFALLLGDIARLCSVVVAIPKHLLYYFGVQPHLSSIDCIRLSSVHASYHSRSSSTKLGNCDLLSQKMNSR